MHLAISIIWWSVSGSLKMRAKMRRSFQCQMAPEVLTVPKMKTTPNTSLYLIVLQPNPTFSQLLWWQLVTVVACCYLFSFWLFHQRSVKPRNGVYAAAYADLFLFHMMAIVIAVPWYNHDRRPWAEQWSLWSLKLAEFVVPWSAQAMPRWTGTSNFTARMLLMSNRWTWQSSMPWLCTSKNVCCQLVFSMLLMIWACTLSFMDCSLYHNENIIYIFYFWTNHCPCLMGAE